MSDMGVVRTLRPVGTANEFHTSAHYGGPGYGTARVANGNGHSNGYGDAHGAVSAFPVTGTDLRRRVTEEEVELLVLLADGLPVEAIARRLALSDRTVRRRSRAMCDRLGARAPIQVVAWAARQGLI